MVISVIMGEFIKDIMKQQLFHGTGIEPQVKTKTRGWVVRMWLTIDGILIFMGHETRYQ